MKKLYLVDVSSMFFRAYYAIRTLSSPSGMPVNAIYGFLSMVVKLIKDEKPDVMIFCYDRKDPSFRHDLYTEYKANRSEMPEDLAIQIPYIKKLADLLGIPSVEQASFEADDLIGTLAIAGAEQGYAVEIVSGDKDFAQLVNDRIRLFDTMKAVHFGPAEILQKWSVTPAQFIDYLAIVGDSSDNIPGVRGIGEKGAVKLLQQFSSLNEIYQNIAEVQSAGIREKLLASKEMAFLSQKLVTIVTDVPIEKNMDAYHFSERKTDELRALLEELNFKTFEAVLLGSATTVASRQVAVSAAVPSDTTPSISGTNALPASDEGVRFEVKKVSAIAELFSQKKSLQTWGYHFAGVYYLSDGQNYFEVNGSADELAALSDQEKWQWCGFDLKTFWRKLGCQNPQIGWDNSLAAYVVMGASAVDASKVIQKQLGIVTDDEIKPENWFGLQFSLKQKLLEQLESKEMLSIYEKLEAPLSPVLLRMEQRGIAIDRKSLHEQSLDLGKIADGLESEIHRLAGEDFNVASPKQLSVVLFEKMGLATGKKTKTGFSTDTDVLEKMKHPIAEKILSWREVTKLKSTYVDVLPELADENNRVHTTLQQNLTATGRLSSINPNLQNIPVRTERGQKVRSAFVAAAGKNLLCADYSQIELRILAHISEDKGLCQAFADDVDIHQATAAEVFGVALGQVTSEQRRVAKAVNFGIAYGQGAFGLAETLGISRTEATEIIQSYFTKFPGVKSYIEETIKQAHERGFVETLFRRRRYMDELNSKNPALRKFGERAAINAPIQGTASDLVKKAMIIIDRQVKSPLLLQVHDELIFEAEPELLNAEIETIRQTMESVVGLRVPLKVHFAMGTFWGAGE